MQTEKRLHAAVMTEHLLAAVYPYRFAQLLNVLGRMLRQQGIPLCPSVQPGPALS